MPCGRSRLLTAAPTKVGPGLEACRSCGHGAASGGRAEGWAMGLVEYLQRRIAGQSVMLLQGRGWGKSAAMAEIGAPQCRL